jgi:hypothetical protein
MNNPQILRPARDVRIQPYVNNGLIVSSAFKGVGYA